MYLTFLMQSDHHCWKVF